MAPYALAELGMGLTSLAQNESAFPPSPAAVQAGRTALPLAAMYADPDWVELRRAIAAVHAIDSTQILCGAGSMELIAALSTRNWFGYGNSCQSRFS
jgi:histidinol-phosphate aminotransferase/N-methylhydantoinase B